MKQNIVIGMVALVVILSVVQSFQINTLMKDMKNQQSAAPRGAGAIDMNGWTDNEKMMYEHHGTLPQRSQQKSGSGSAQGAGMVGGC